MADAASNDDDGCVFASVAAGDSAEQLRRVIDEFAQGSDERRLLAVNHVGPDGDTPLVAAFSQCRGDLVGALVENGADVGGIFGGRLTPLAVCVLYRQVESVRALLKTGHEADEKVLYMLRDRYIHPPADGSCTAAHLCIAPPLFDRSVPPAPQLECLRVLVREGGADINAQDTWGRTPLYWLAQAASNHEAGLDVLLELGADVNAEVWAYDNDGQVTSRTPCGSPLIEFLGQCIVYRRDSACVEACVRKLLSAGARAHGVYDELDHSPLMRAAYCGMADVARLLLDAGAPVDERSPVRDTTALICAANDADEPPAVLTLLLDAGADVNALERQGRTAMVFYAHCCTLAQLRLLLDRGASPDVIDQHGHSILYLANAGVRNMGEQGRLVF
jgi:ankyrin repeat protein